jgi:glycerol-3-phosphate acyltransferase PlsY
MDFFNTNIVFLAIAYLVGSIPFGLLLAKFFAGVDVQKSGSKSIGATNVLRVVKQTNPKLAKQLGAITIILDAIKGAIIVLIGMLYGLNDETLWGIAVVSVLGHCYSIFLWLEGGKGVATGLGVFLLLIPVPTLIGIGVWAFSAKVLKISSLSSLIGLSAVVIATIILQNGLTINANTPVYIIAVTIFYKHIPNIIRLFQGNEEVL